ncbi:hypothetical protein FHX44_111160 [Pseudonocardia hierapolitana]|uniref:Uncharacterized protein n=1 Tax=Pseudonocardia hierapolitana TaxID=1128676 RepID=A0A561SK61_9PSEU|nr:hypothetical protein [Pseudonocardia hierapolitana]TWF75276.1 hypothetical protein FHX44_111160 [Pseudonocardia hierapolitana]
MAASRSASDLDLDLDGLRFAMVSSTASDVDPSSPTIFDYHERDGMIWGEYEGDTVRIGRFVGTRAGRRISIRFTHVVAATGAVVSGTAESRIEQHEDGLRLVEDFRTADGDQVSVCAQIGPGRAPRHPRSPG